MFIFYMCANFFLVPEFDPTPCPFEWNHSKLLTPWEYFGRFLGKWIFTCRGPVCSKSPQCAWSSLDVRTHPIIFQNIKDRIVY